MLTDRDELLDAFKTIKECCEPHMGCAACLLYDDEFKPECVIQRFPEKPKDINMSKLKRTITDNWKFLSSPEDEL